MFMSIIQNINKEINGYTDFSRKNTTLEFNDKLSSGFSTSDSHMSTENFAQREIEADLLEKVKICAGKLIIL